MFCCKAAPPGSLAFHIGSATGAGRREDTMTLLIADDELVIRQGLQSLDWASIGVTEVYTVQNGTEARELLLSTPIDLVLMDIKMPGMTGLELASMIKERSMDTAVVLLTGFSEFEYAREAMRTGVYEYLLKPLRRKEILSTMSGVIAALERKRYQEQLMRRLEQTTGATDTVDQVKNRFSGSSVVMQEILEDMAQHYNQPLSIGSIADRYHFSRNYLSKLFKKETGCSFTDILTAIRLANAAQQLLEGSRISVVSANVGFQDQRYFSQVFRKVFGCIPKEFQKQESSRLDLSFSALLERIEKQGMEER